VDLMLGKVARIGRQAALAAGAVMRQNYLKPHRVTLKGAIDPVTETDYQAQETIVALIRQAFPDHGFLAEEREREGGRDEDLGEGAKGPRPLHLQKTPPSPLPQSLKGLNGPEKSGPEAPPSPATPSRGLGGELEGRAGDLLSPGPSPKTVSPYRWIIDPLDGTVNFAHGFPMFCVSIAFEAEGKLLYGVVYEPLRDELFEAQKGEGSLVNGQLIRVSRTDRLERALVATGFPYDIRERLPETTARLARVLGVVQGVRRAGSAALDMCYVACGRLDGFFEENLKPWDTAAGLLIITEAGGRITTFEGGEYDLYSPNILASNEILHGKLMNCLKG
jgi:myo-inositol-1(or 4)-monophosphatase